MAQYLHNMGYELKGNGFINPGGKLKFDESDRNKVTEIDSKYIWAYLVADNGMYMVKNKNFNLGDFFSHLFDSEEWGAGMINFDNWSVSDWLSSVTFNREDKTMTIKIPNGIGNGVGTSDVTTFNIDGWSGRYGKPLDFLLSLHLATMAPDLTYELATNKNFETTVHVNMLKVKLKIETTITDINGHNWTLEDFENFVKNGKIGEDPITFLPPKSYYVDEAGNKIPIYYTYNEVYEALKQVNDEEFWTYLPYIKWVEKHWFRDVYFDVDAEDIKIYTNNVKGETTDSIEVVEKEKKEDGEYWDKYNTLDEYGYSEELSTKTIDGVHVYRIVENGDYTALEQSILTGSILQNFNTDVNIEGYKIVQVADAERGVTNKAIKDLFAQKYYIYDGTEVTAGEIEKAAKNKDESIKKEISMTRDSLAAFTILENTHTLDADYIYKDFKELLVELKYFKQEELIGDNIKVLKWPIPDYNKDNGYELWPDNEVDKPVYEYGTYITSKSNYGTEEATVKNTKLASLEFVTGVETLKIADNETDGSEESNDDSTKIKNEGFESGKDVVSPANGKIESMTGGGVKITIDDSEEYTTNDGENICSGYQMVISGFSTSKTSGTVKAGEKIGTTTNENIKIMLLDEDKAVVENVENYIILPGEEKEDKNVQYGQGYSLDDYGEQGGNSDNNGDDNNNNNNNNNGDDNNNNNNNNNNGDDNNNENPTTSSDSILASVNGYRTKEDIMYAVKNTSGWSNGMIANVESMMEGLLRLQNDFDIDPLVAIALFRGESSVGTAYMSRGEYRLDNHQHWSNTRGQCNCAYHQYQGFACYNNYSDNAYDWGNYVHNRFANPITTWSGLASTDGMTIYQNCNVDDGSHAISFYKKLVETLNNR